MLNRSSLAATGGRFASWSLGVAINMGRFAGSSGDRGPSAHSATEDNPLDAEHVVVKLLR